MFIGFFMMLIGGILLYKFPPPDNMFVGYRTKRASKDSKSWYFAQKKASILTIIFSFVSFGLDLLSRFITSPKLLATIIECNPAWLLLLVVLLTEIQLVRREKRKVEK